MLVMILKRLKDLVSFELKSNENSLGKRNANLDCILVLIKYFSFSFRPAEKKALRICCEKGFFLSTTHFFHVAQK